MSIIKYIIAGTDTYKSQCSRPLPSTARLASMLAAVSGDAHTVSVAIKDGTGSKWHPAHKVRAGVGACTENI